MSNAFSDNIRQMQTLDLQLLQSFYGDLTDEELKEVLQRFYQEAKLYHQRLLKAIAMQNVMEVIRLSHSLKSMAAITGAEQYSTLCMWIERMMRSDELDDLMELSLYLSPLWQQLELSIQAKLGPEALA
ncbi:Hpt domain-containing protein [Alkalimonas collagenimarina]|uniref:Hpt domain-containing protein n=1 Tax=Alkalimonas collagenimarina TaxID=400390 RepID=A0ABT9GWK5_9GAMM|nr:Hpt domain-containing protein [Alkalimonas collagenimarina]MDP4535343.1 Hpt domain-containing protein [Alkalimonas collagenimarina]